MDSFASSAYSVAVDKTMDAGGGSKPPAEVRAPRRTGSTVIDISGMKSAAEGGSDLEVEELSIGFDHDKQDTQTLVTAKQDLRLTQLRGRIHKQILMRKIVSMKWIDTMPTK